MRSLIKKLLEWYSRPCAAFYVALRSGNKGSITYRCARKHWHHGAHCAWQKVLPTSKDGLTSQATHKWPKRGKS